MKLSNGVDNDHKWPRVCDTCQSAASKVYCRADNAYLCRTCDSRVHEANHFSLRHERVWVCDACECAPAAFLCKADAASLCAACDVATHSANPLAGRHQRVPIMPFSGSNITEDDGGTVDFLAQGGDDEDDEEDDDEAASWLLLNPVKSISNEISCLFGDDVDDYLDLEDYNHGEKNQFSEQQQSDYHTQQTRHGLVPIKGRESKEQIQQQQQGHSFSMGFGFGYSCSGSYSQSVSGSSMDVGIVPESTIAEDSLAPDPRLANQTIELYSGSQIQMPQQLSQMDREARVLRYREKRKTRKFEKTIRYASRKAYAETRPRIKGRFAKRTEAAEDEVDQKYPTTLITASGYGIVPNF